MQDPPHMYAPMLRLISSAYRSTEFALFDLRKGIDDAEVIDHQRGGSSTAAERSAAIKAFADLMRPCVAAQKNGAIELSYSGLSTRFPMYCLILLAQRESNVIAAATFIIKCFGNKDAAGVLECMERGRKTIL